MGLADTEQEVSMVALTSMLPVLVKACALDNRPRPIRKASAAEVEI
jgi:hypothetical protein